MSTTTVKSGVLGLLGLGLAMIRIPSLMSFYKKRTLLRRLKTADIVVVSISKSGRTWLRAMLSRYYQSKFNLPETELLEFDNLHHLNANAPRILFIHAGDLLRLLPEKTHLANKRVVHLVRWPIDTSVSQYFQASGRTTAFRRGLVGLPVNIADLTIHDFVSSSSHGVDTLVQKLNDIYVYMTNHGALLTLRYEDARKDSASTLREFLVFAGESPVDDAVQLATAATQFDKLKKAESEGHFSSWRLRPKNKQNADSFKVRRGKVGGYRDYFSEQESSALELKVRGELNPFYGYKEFLR